MRSPNSRANADAATALPCSDTVRIELTSKPAVPRRPMDRMTIDTNTSIKVLPS